MPPQAPLNVITLTAKRNIIFKSKKLLFHFEILAHNYIDMDNNHRPNTDDALDLDLDAETQEPKFYKVLLHNDDYTPMDFVIFVLKKFFNKLDDDAYKIMLDVHHKGVGIAGVYSFEVAETKVMQVNQFSKVNQHPLKTSYEEES